MTRTLVSGATGFIGSRLADSLTDHGHEVVAMTRRPEAYDGPGVAVGADVTEPDSLREALAGVEVAYYLVHSLDQRDFVRRDAEAAEAFGRAAWEAEVDRIVYLGGLGRDDDDLSDHLRSRREVEVILGDAGVPVTVLRAGVVVGRGGLSWEMTRRLAAILPGLVAPDWMETRTQPIAVRDVVRYLVGVLEVEETRGRVLEAGGPDVLSYREMLQVAARLQGAELPTASLPRAVSRFLPPSLSADGLALLTDTDPRTAAHLVGSLVNEAVVTDPAILELVPGECLTYEEAATEAIVER